MFFKEFVSRLFFKEKVSRCAMDEIFNLSKGVMRRQFLKEEFVFRNFLIDVFVLYNYMLIRS